MMNTTNEASGKSLGQLLGDLARETSTLVHQEVQLAKTEITEKVTSAVKGSALLVVAATTGFVAFQVVVAAAVLALAQTLSPPLAALVVAAVLLVVTGVFAFLGLKAMKKGTDVVPHKTVETLKQDAQWAKEQLS